MMETFETEREALWSMISKQAQIIQRMNRAGNYGNTVTHCSQLHHHS